MAIFKFSMKPNASEKARATTVQPGPFLVEASDQEIGRRLLMANFVIATRRFLRKRAPHPVWSEKGPSECIELDPALDPKALQQRKEVAGIDIATWFLTRLEIASPDGGRYARMLWWPCSAEDRCPV
jgi:hypothetical protein